jgi:hypothetical protein
MIKKIDDGKNDIIIGHPDGPHVLINEAMIKHMGTTYEKVTSSQTEIAVFLQAVVLRMCNHIKEQGQGLELKQKIENEDMRSQLQKDEMLLWDDFRPSPYNTFNKYFHDHQSHWLNELGKERFIALFDYLTKIGHIW